MGIQPDNITVLSLILALAQLKNLKLAGSVMAYVIHKGFDKDTAIRNALVDLYARYGDILSTRKIFDGMLIKDGVSWSVMVNGYGLHGNGEAATELFSQMQFAGEIPDEITVLSVLSACSHTGLVDQARNIIDSMAEQGISPKMEHYACMVDLLGRTGYLEEAYNMIKKLPCKPSFCVLESLLGSCKIHGDIELGKKISRMISQIYPDNSGSYVVLSNMYAAAGRWTDANRVRSSIEEKRLRKQPGFSFVTEMF